MHALTLLDGLDADPRPTCVIDLLATEGPLIAFRNTALHRQASLGDDLVDSRTTREITGWLLDREATGSRSTPAGHSVWIYDVEQRWRVVQWQWQAPEGASRDVVTRMIPADKDASQSLDDLTGKLQNLLRMIEMVDVGIFEYDARGVLQYGNDSFYKLSGHPRDSKRDTVTWKDSIFPEDEAWLEEQWAQMTKGIPITFEMRWKRPAETMPGEIEDVEGQPVLAACVPTTDEQGNVVSVSGCITDIAAQARSKFDAEKRAEAMENVLQAERRFATFCSVANIGIWILDNSRQLTFGNDEWFRVSGHPQCNFQDVDWTKLIDAANLALVSGAFDEMRRTKLPVTFEFELLRLYTDPQGGSMRSW